MRIFIQHTDMEYYEFYDDFKEVQNYPSGNNSFQPMTTTEIRDFPIGSKVYFQGIGWTEAVQSNILSSKAGCALSGKCKYDLKCLNRIFKKIEIKEKAETAKKKTYVINSENHETYEVDGDVIDFCKKRAMHFPGVTFHVVEVVASYKSKVIVEEV